VSVGECHTLITCYRVDESGSEARASVEWLSGLAAGGTRISVLTGTPQAAVHPGLKGNENVRVISVLRSATPTMASEGRLRRDYLIWSRLVAGWLRETDLSAYTVAHHLSWGSLTAPTPLARAGIPFVWGPVGGGQSAPTSLMSLMPVVPAARELGRMVRLKAARLIPGVTDTARRATVILATNDETVRAIKRLGGHDVRLMPDSAVTLPAPARAATAQQRRLVWIGRLEPHKAPILAVRTLSRLPGNVTLDVVGSGTEMPRLVEESRRRGLAGRVRFHGTVAHHEVSDLLDGATTTLFTSLRDSFGPVVLESLSQGVPVVAIGHQGVTLHPDQLVRKVPVGFAGRVEKQLAGRVQEILALSPSESEALHRQCRTYVLREHLWSRRASALRDIYLEVSR
jgi:glycosyltransferase involved in cell wall biosynthesis